MSLSSHELGDLLVNLILGHTVQLLLDFLVTSLKNVYAPLMGYLNMLRTPAE